MSHFVALFYRLLGGLILSAFALVCGWGALNVIRGLFAPEERLTVASTAIIAVSLTLTYLLSLLAFRAFTGHGRKQDGRLIPLWALKALVSIYAAFAAIVVGLGLYRGNFQMALGAGISLLSFAFFYWRAST